MFMRNAWYVAATLKEITDQPLARTLLNEPVVLFRNGQNDVCALEDRCCHRGAPLSLGNTTEAGIRCGYHGMEFDCAGQCIAIPGQTTIPKRARVKSYPVVTKGDYLWIWMGDADLADPSTVLDYPPDDQVNWPRSNDMLHLKASYVMVLENLMDLSHLSYLHKTSIGSSENDSANATMDVQRTPRGMKFLRVMRDADAPANWLKRYPTGKKIDRWSDFEYVAPSAIMQFSGGVNAGDYDKGVRSGSHLGRTLHAITPETDKSCFYFFNKADGYSKYEDPDTPHTWQSITDVFKEDAFMLEQQQLRLENFDTSKLLDINTDTARVQMIRVLKERIRQEQQQEEERQARQQAAQKEPQSA
jgi:phenylpropionate dioxygenase-like ring-hydroxylating dioxygenase large terminal subunit